MFSYAAFPCYLQYQMVELEIFKVNQSVIWNGKQTDTTKEKRNNHARIHFTFICCPDVSKDTKGQEFLKTNKDKNNFLIGNLLPDTTKIKCKIPFQRSKISRSHDRIPGNKLVYQEI